MNGIITAIQRFSLSDGDGIRTTVFFKGCNMRCSWCHNPETLQRQPELLFYETKCIGCGKCLNTCPNGVHKILSGKHILDRSKCTNCGQCAEVCYAEALVICGTAMTTEEVMKQIRQDLPYYKNSGGGVTFSGGEVFCQQEFVSALCDACHQEDIATAIETNLCYNFDQAKGMLEKADLIMCDLKIFHSEQHKFHTGVPNEMILDNINKLDTLNIPLIVRTPLIPGATDSVENIEAIISHIKNLKNLRRYEILNFNPLGDGKYKALDKQNPFAKQRPLEDSSLTWINKLLESSGIPYKII